MKEFFAVVVVSIMIFLGIINPNFIYGNIGNYGLDSTRVNLLIQSDNWGITGKILTLVESKP